VEEACDQNASSVALITKASRLGAINISTTNVLRLAIWALERAAKVISRSGNFKTLFIFHLGQQSSIEISWQFNLKTI
jgi:hypothetical protein